MKDFADPPRAIPQTPLVVNPFSINFSASESAAINTGAAMYRTHILSLPGRGGFGFNLDLLYSTQRADFHSLRVHQNPAESTAQPRHNLHGLGVGWIFDLPYIIDYMLYIPGRGSFAIDGETIVDYYLYDMRLRYYNDFRIGDLQSTRRLDFLNGTSYFFHYQHIIGMQDRFGNTIRFYYVDDRWSDMRLLSQIVDSAGSIIDFYNQAFYDGRRRVTITAPDASTYVIYMSPSYDDIILTQVHNQAGNVTSFEYQIATFDFQFIWQNEGQSRTALLRYVRYQSGASLSLGYGRGEINLGVTGSRFIYRLTHRALLSNGREYLRTDISYLGDHTGRWCASGRFNGNIDRPVDYPDGENRFIYAVIITQNNGVVTEYTFNSRHLNEFRTINTPPGTQGASSAQFIRHNDNRLPYFIWLSESYSGNTRETIQRFEYNRYGQVTRALSPKAHGHDIWHYWTRFYYDNRFGLLHRRLFWTDQETEIDERNYFCDQGKRITRSTIAERGVWLSRTEFVHDPFGNVIESRAFPEVFDYNNFITTYFTHIGGFTLPSTITVRGIRDFYGNLADGGGMSRTHFLFDAMGRTIAATDPNGYATTWEYDTIGRITRINHPDGGVEAFTYNDYYNIMYHRTVLGAVYRYEHDPLGNLLNVTPGYAQRFCRYCCGVDQKNDFLFGGGRSEILTNTFDTRMRLVSTTNAQGETSSNNTVFTYDVFDRVTSTTVYSASWPTSGHVLSHTTTRYHDVYGSHGNSRIVTTRHGQDWAGAPSIVTFVQLDRYGRQSMEGTVGGRVITYSHDIIGRITREQSLGLDNRFTHSIHGITHLTNILGYTARSYFDHMGRLTRSYDFRGHDQRFYYDSLGRIIRHYTPMSSPACCCGASHVWHTPTSYYYDRGGNLIRSFLNLSDEDVNFRITTNTFSHNRLASSHVGNDYVHSTHGITTEYTYDYAGNILTKRVGGHQVISHSYDNRGRLIETRDAMGFTEQFAYDHNSHLYRRVDRNGSIFHYTFDGLGRLTEAVATEFDWNTRRYRPISSKRTYSFHLTGAIRQRQEFQLNLTDPGPSDPWSWHSPATIHYLYDPQGRVVRQDKHTPCGNIVIANTYIYNEANNVTNFATLVNEGFHAWEYIDYDLAQRPVTVRTIPMWGGVLATYTYDANNNRTSTTLPNGVVAEYTFNAGNLVTSVVNRQLANYEYGIEGRILSSFEYMHGGDGNAHRVMEHFYDNRRDRRIYFAYDMASRLRFETAGSLRPSGNGYTRNFFFDSRGNRASMSEALHSRCPATGAFSRVTYTTTYTYDLNNRLIAETRRLREQSNYGHGDVGHVYSNHYVTTSFTYDRNGNQLTSRSTDIDPITGAFLGRFTSRAYNAFNQLVSFSKEQTYETTESSSSQSLVATYTYWPNGLRKSRTINGVRTYQVWNRDQMVLELDADGHAINRYYIALVKNHRIASRHHGFYLFNARGDVVQRVDADGNILRTYQYDAFGNLIAERCDCCGTPYAEYIATGETPNPFRFGGEHYDFERGEYYLRARSFSPRIGRFTQPDPFWGIHNMQAGTFAILQSANLFVFVMNNPVRWVDPSGLFADHTMTSPLAPNDAMAGGAAIALFPAITHFVDALENVAPILAYTTIAVMLAPIALPVIAATAAISTAASVVQDYWASHTGGFAGSAASSSVTATASWPQDFIDVLERTDARTATGEPIRFFSAEVDSRTDMLVPLMPLTIQGAHAHIMGIIDNERAEGVLALTDADAQALLHKLDGRPGRGRWDRGRRGIVGHFPHYHPAVQPHAHIWYVR